MHAEVIQILFIVFSLTVFGILFNFITFLHLFGWGVGHLMKHRHGFLPHSHLCEHYRQVRVG